MFGNWKMRNIYIMFINNIYNLKNIYINIYAFNYITY